MKKKRVIILLAVGVLALSSLVSCGKEEKTGYEQMKEDVQSELAENEQLHSEAQANEEELNEKWRSKLEESYLSYENSTDPDKIIKNAIAYNLVFNEMTIDVENSGFKPMNCSQINDFLVNISKTQVEISELEYNTKSLYYELVSQQDYENFTYYYSKEDNFFIFVLSNNNDDGLLSEIMIVKPDKSTLKFSISDFEKNNYENADIYTCTEDSLIFWTNFNADSYYYVVDITNSTTTLTDSGQGGCENYEQEYDSVKDSINDDGLSSLIYKIRTY